MSTRVVLLFNPSSGRGKAERFAHALTDALHEDGWLVDQFNVGMPDTETGLDGAFEGARAVVVIGGDGTVHRTASRIARIGVPMVIAPMGTENLLAKELGMGVEVDQVRRAVRDGEVSHIDLPTVNGASFLVMCSVGLDAAIVAAVDSMRTGKIRRSTYIKPVLQEASRPTLPALRVTVDGVAVCNGRQGMLVVANCRRYAVGLNPAKDASMTDARLDVAFYPMRNTFDAIRWALLSRLGWHDTARGFLKARGRVIEIVGVSDVAAPVQVDGEPAPAGVALPLRFIADAGRLAVLRINER